MTVSKKTRQQNAMHAKSVPAVARNTTGFTSLPLELRQMIYSNFLPPDGKLYIPLTRHENKHGGTLHAIDTADPLLACELRDCIYRLCRPILVIIPDCVTELPQAMDWSRFTSIDIEIVYPRFSLSYHLSYVRIRSYSGVKQAVSSLKQTGWSQLPDMTVRFREDDKMCRRYYNGRVCFSRPRNGTRHINCPCYRTHWGTDWYERMDTGHVAPGMVYCAMSQDCCLDSSFGDYYQYRLPWLAEPKHGGRQAFFETKGYPRAESKRPDPIVVVILRHIMQLPRWKSMAVMPLERFGDVLPRRNPISADTFNTAVEQLKRYVNVEWRYRRLRGGSESTNDNDDESKAR